MLFGAMIKLEMVWGIADILNGLMAAPNLIALIILSPVVVHLIRNFEGIFSNFQKSDRGAQNPVQGRSFSID